jgi:hypothetical protein
VVEVMRRALARTGNTAGFAPILAGQVQVPAAMRELARVHRQHDVSRVLDAAERLIGLGSGLTPSGDDFLVGFSAALWSKGDPLAQPFSNGCATRAANRTTDVAVEFYNSAARGEFSARLHNLLAAIADSDHGPDQQRLQREFRQALAWGATSGADCVLGVLLGLFGPTCL